MAYGTRQILGKSFVTRLHCGIYRTLVWLKWSSE